MSAKLYGRTHKTKSDVLIDGKYPDYAELKLIGKFTNYHVALVVGRRDFDHGNFYVEKPANHGSPSREEQLLQPKWNPNNLDQT